MEYISKVKVDPLRIKHKKLEKPMNSTKRGNINVKQFNKKGTIYKKTPDKISDNKIILSTAICQ